MTESDKKILEQIIVQNSFLIESLNGLIDINYSIVQNIVPITFVEIASSNEDDFPPTIN